MMIPTMTEYGSGFLASLQKKMEQTKSKSFLIEDILNMREDHMFSSSSPTATTTAPSQTTPSECESECYDSVRHDGKRIRGPRKDRTIFSKIQLFRLERRFHDQKYLSSYEKALIAHSLQLTQQQVQTWFQNRRAKAKREEREKKKQRGSQSSDNHTSFESTDDVPNTRLSDSEPENNASHNEGFQTPSSVSRSPPAPSSLPLASPRTARVSPTLSSSSNSLVSPDNGLLSPMSTLVASASSLVPPGNTLLTHGNVLVTPGSVVTPKITASLPVTELSPTLRAPTSPPVIGLTRISSPMSGVPASTPISIRPKKSSGTLHSFSIDSLTRQ